MSLRKLMSLVVIVLTLFAVACGGDDKSADEARADLCDDLDSMETTLTALAGMGTNASIDDLKEQRDEVSSAWDDVVDSANDVEDAEVDQLEQAYDTLNDAVDDISDDMPIEDAVASISDELAAVSTAWTDLRTTTDCT